MYGFGFRFRCPGFLGLGVYSFGLLGVVFRVPLGFRGFGGLLESRIAKLGSWVVPF